jgi:3-deoxy-D-glycero-D-galacto-nononate 9-phosphate synthase
MSTYIIAEIGQNHNGDKELAFDLIRMAAQPVYYKGELLKGADAVKFTVRDMEAEITNEFFNSKYKNKNSYGDTYGEHRNALELSYNDICELRNYAKDLKLDFILTLCQHTLVAKYSFMCDKIKVASRDLDNIPLLYKITETNRDVILSTGMAEDDYDLERAITILSNGDRKIDVLHCVSSYPAEYKDLGLERLIHYDIEIPNIDKVGFSDHTTGILAAPIAVALGAEIIEKHITLDREMKGSDHTGSMGPDGFHKLIRDIRNTEVMINKSYEGLVDSTAVNKVKLGRSLAFNKDMLEGEPITVDDLYMISPGHGLKCTQDNVTMICNSKLRHFVDKNKLVEEGDFCE